MARRRPAQVRADGPGGSRTITTEIPTIPGLSYRGRIAVARLERDRYWLGATEAALCAWLLLLRDPWHRLFDPTQSCGDMQCCPSPAELRALLGAVAHVLPKKDARMLRKRIGDLDDL